MSQRNCSSCSPFNADDNDDDDWPSPSKTPFIEGPSGGAINGTRSSSSYAPIRGEKVALTTKGKDKVSEANERLLVKPPDRSNGRGSNESSTRPKIYRVYNQFETKPTTTTTTTTSTGHHSHFQSFKASAPHPGIKQQQQSRKAGNWKTGSPLFSPLTTTTTTKTTTSNRSNFSNQFRAPQVTRVTATGGAGRPLSESSRRLLETANKDHELELWLAARNYRQSDHYDYSLFGLSSHLDQAVAQHQRQAMLYNQGESLLQFTSRAYTFLT